MLSKLHMVKELRERRDELGPKAHVHNHPSKTETYSLKNKVNLLI